MSYTFTDYFIDDITEEVILINENYESLNDVLHQCQFGHLFKDRFILKLKNKEEIVHFLKEDFGINKIITFYNVIYNKKITEEEIKNIIDNDPNELYESLIVNYKEYFQICYQMYGIDVPSELCPICNFSTITDDIVKEYMYFKIKKYGYDVYKEIRKAYKREHENYPIKNSEFFEYMNEKYGLKISDMKKEIKENFKNYSEFIEKTKARD